jgi:hypothetical protein
MGELPEMWCGEDESGVWGLDIEVCFVVLGIIEFGEV